MDRDNQIRPGSLFVTLWSWLRIPVAVLVLTAILAPVYYSFTNTDQPFRFITPGAALAVVVWLAASLGFSFCVRNVADYSATYGSIGAIVVLLFLLVHLGGRVAFRRRDERGGLPSGHQE